MTAHDETMPQADGQQEELMDALRYGCDDLPPLSRRSKCRAALVLAFGIVPGVFLVQAAVEIFWPLLLFGIPAAFLLPLYAWRAAGWLIPMSQEELDSLKKPITPKPVF